MQHNEEQILEELLSSVLPRKYNTPAVKRAFKERFSSVQELLYHNGEGWELFLPTPIVRQLLERFAVVLEFCIRSCYVTLGQQYSLQNRMAFVHMAMMRVSSLYREKIYAFLLTKNAKYIALESVAVGSENIAVFDIAIILEKMAYYNAKKIILVHNHPTGNTLPSEEDLYATASIKEALFVRRYELVDHWIVSLEQAYSIFEEKRLL